jgi:hypothetical protein
MALKKQYTGTILPYNAQSGFADRDIQLTFPAYCFYEDVNFTYARTNGKEEFLSDIFHIHNYKTPVHSYFDASITPEKIPVGKEDKLCLVQVTEDEISYAGAYYKKGKVHAKLRNFGNYSIAIDTIEPIIEPLNFHSGKDFSNMPGMRFTVVDELSGINEYRGLIDNQWVLFEYDPKNDLLFYEFDKRMPISKKNHELEIYLSDMVGNTKIFHSTFFR